MKGFMYSFRNASVLQCYLVLLVTPRHLYKAHWMFSEGFAAVMLRIGKCSKPIQFSVHNHKHLFWILSIPVQGKDENINQLGGYFELNETVVFI